MVSVSVCCVLEEVGSGKGEIVTGGVAAPFRHRKATLGAKSRNDVATGQSNAVWRSRRRQLQ